MKEGWWRGEVWTPEGLVMMVWHVETGFPVCRFVEQQHQVILLLQSVEFGQFSDSLSVSVAVVVAVIHHNTGD